MFQCDEIIEKETAVLLTHNGELKGQHLYDWAFSKAVNRYNLPSLELILPLKIPIMQKAQNHMML